MSLHRSLAARVARSFTNPEPDLAPRSRSRVSTPLAAGFDRAMSALIFARGAAGRTTPPPGGATPSGRLAMLQRIDAYYAAHPAAADPERLFPTRLPIALEERRVGELPGGEILELRWTSELSPLTTDLDVVQQLDERAPSNSRALARLFTHHGGARPTIVLIHGYLGGAFAFEERAFPVRWLHSLGLDVVLAVLPHHGPRAPRGAHPLLPANDPRLTIEGMRHAMHDLRTLTRLLRARGAPAVGAMGMSLGGYSTALLATLEPLDFAIPMIPLASIADFARDDDRFIGTATQRAEQHAALERALRLVSPLERSSRVDPSRALVIAGQGDRITPRAHAEKLAAHFGAPLHVFRGGHLLQVGRHAGFAEVAALLHREGLIASPG